MATYIDLNPVHAEMVEDPKDYRHCGYGAAMGGDCRCRKGIMAVMEICDWKEASAALLAMTWESPYDSPQAVRQAPGRMAWQVSGQAALQLSLLVR